ncbi:MAG TPA: ATP phosphoribosyltransferase [Spirochaetia bacterium]|nr:ATP phosphoribosyltransferase [Spirochaetia bacterium]
MPSSKKLKLTIPNGHLGQKSIDIFQKAYYKISGQDRSYRPGFSDPDVELRVLRPQEIPLYISDGIQDVGITGIDWITETGANVEEVLDLEFGGVKLVAATPKSQPYDTVNELMESFWKKGEDFRVSAEYLNVTAGYLKSQPAYKKRFGSKEPMIITPWWRKGDNPKAAVYLSFGATEAKPPEIVDMIVDVTETGTTLEQNNLKQIGTLMRSTARLVANKEAMKDSWKREKIKDLKIMLSGVVEGQKRLHIFVNVRAKNLDKLLKELPALKRPTISPLSEKGWYDVNTVISKKDLHAMLPTLKRLAQGLVIHEPQNILSLEEFGEGNE